MKKVFLIYNPKSGSKKVISKLGLLANINEIENLLLRYQIDFDFAETQYPKHASELARHALQQGYEEIVVCGGDGTVNEVVQEVVGTEVVLGIIPRGTYMNTATMLSIPFNPEMAVELLKIKRTRKIDLGIVNTVGGVDLKTPYYFLEASGVGLDAEIQKQFLEIERGKFWKYAQIIRTFFSFYLQPITVIIDGETRRVKSTLINISNGPYTGANLVLAPEAKLNDHRLTVAFTRMSKLELILYFFKIDRIFKEMDHKITTYQGNKVEVRAYPPRAVHADASFFGYTPVKYGILPNALNVICGFPKPDAEPILDRRSKMDP